MCGDVCVSIPPPPPPPPLSHTHIHQPIERVTSRLTRNRCNRLASADSYAGFEGVVERDHWYRMLLEIQSGWKISQARKDPGVMETATCHVVLLDAIVGSGQLDRMNHTQKSKCMMVSRVYTVEPL